MAILLIEIPPKKAPEQIPEGYFDRPVRKVPREPEAEVNPFNREIGLKEVERFRGRRK